MKNSYKIALIAISFVLGIAASCFAQPSQISGFQAGWFDEFNGSSVDTGKWNVITDFNPTNQSLHAYLPGQVSVSGGNLVISSSDIPFLNFDYRSGQVQSTAVQQYGRWEVRAQLPSTRGTWPAIWLLPDSPWPSQGEIDIMENRGDEPNQVVSAFHYGTNSPLNVNSRSQNYQSQVAGSPSNFHSGFHTYALEWDSTQIRYYVDDVHHFTVRDSDVGGFLSSQTSGMRLIMNTAIGGHFLNNPDASSSFPQNFLIDYVHTYTLNGAAVLTFDNGGFEEQGGSLAQWTTFGNSIQNVSAVTDQTFEGDGALKLYGQFNGGANFSGVAQGISVEEGDELRASLSSLVLSADSIVGTSNRVSLKIDYYSENYGAFGSAAYLGSDEIFIADGSSLEDIWQDFELYSVAPAGAVEARLAIVFSQFANESGAVYVDHLQFSVVPEPGSSCLLLLLAGTLLGHRRRRRRSSKRPME